MTGKSRLPSLPHSILRFNEAFADELRLVGESEECRSAKLNLKILISEPEPFTDLSKIAGVAIRPEGKQNGRIYPFPLTNL